MYTCALSLCRALPVLLCVWWNTHTQTSRLAHFASYPLRRSRLSAPPSSPSHRHGTLRETRNRDTLSRGSLSRKKKERMRASWPPALLTNRSAGQPPVRQLVLRVDVHLATCPDCLLPTWSPTPNLSKTFRSVKPVFTGTLFSSMNLESGHLKGHLAFGQFTNGDCTSTWNCKPKVISAISNYVFASTSRGSRGPSRSPLPGPTQEVPASSSPVTWTPLRRR